MTTVPVAYAESSGEINGDRFKVDVFERFINSEESIDKSVVAHSEYQVDEQGLSTAALLIYFAPQPQPRPSNQGANCLTIIETLTFTHSPHQTTPYLAQFHRTNG